MNINKKFNLSSSPDYAKLQTTLVNARIQDENNALFQTIQGLINAGNTTNSNIEKKLDSDAEIPSTQITGLLPVTQNVYLPVLTSIANVTASAAFYTWWTRIGNIVNVWGKVTITPTAANTATELRLSLPFPSAFQHEEQLSGTANGYPFAVSTTMQPMIIVADVANLAALIRFYSVDTEDMDVRFIFSYLMIAK